MQLNIDAFADELTKISEARDPVTRERVIRALQAAGATAGGYGLGWGLGNLVMNTKVPEYIRAKVPSPKLLGIGGAGLGLLSQLANDDVRRRFSEYVKGGKQ